jgi:protein-S-isoprenylcysteine O-methyltransferase Ste14
VHSVILAAIGALLFACGIALAVWARLHLGRNWGMPMTQRAEPELVLAVPDGPEVAVRLLVVRSMPMP